MKRLPLLAPTLACLALTGPAASAQLFPPQQCPGGRCPQACYPSPAPFVPVPAVVPQPMPSAPASGFTVVEDRAFGFAPVLFPRLRSLIADRPRLFTRR